MSNIEVLHDGPNGTVVKKRFTDATKAREYAEGKVYAGGPAQIRVDEGEDEPASPARRRTRGEPEPEEPLRRRKARAKPKPKAKVKPRRKA